MKWRLAGLSVVAVVAACKEATAPPADSALLVASAATGSSATPFQAFAVTCSGDQSVVLEARQTGNTLHLELLNQGTLVSDNPLLAGSIVVRVSVNVNLRDPSNPAGSFTGSLLISPSAVSGTWEGSFGGHLNGGRLDGLPPTPVDAVMTAQGTGSLAGLQLKFNHQINPAYETPALPSGCSFGGERWTGVIRDPAS